MEFHHRHGEIRSRVLKSASHTICGRGSWWISHIHHRTSSSYCRALQPHMIPFNSLAGYGVKQMHVLGFRCRLDMINARCKLVGEDRNLSILWGRKTLAVCFGRQCRIRVSSLDARPVQGTQRWIVKRWLSLKLCAELNMHVHRMNIRHAQGHMADFTKENWHAT